MTDNILEVRHLSTQFFTRAGPVKAADDISFEIKTGSTLALVGESGSGKSVTSLSIMRLVPPPGKITAGEIVFGGQDLIKLGDERMRRLRGREVAMIFQDPMTSLIRFTQSAIKSRKPSNCTNICPGNKPGPRRLR